MLIDKINVVVLLVVFFGMITIIYLKNKQIKLLEKVSIELINELDASEERYIYMLENVVFKDSIKQ